MRPMREVGSRGRDVRRVRGGSKGRSIEMKLGELMVRQGLLTEDQVEQALWA